MFSSQQEFNEMVKGAERALLGACLVDNKAIYSVAPILNDNKFFLGTKEKEAYSVLLDMHKSQIGIDMLTATNRSKELNKNLDAIFWVELTQAVAGSAHVEHHANIVRNGWKSRMLYSTYARAAASLAVGNELQEVLDQVNKDMIEVQEDINERVDTLEGAVQKLMKHAMEVSDRDGELAGLPFVGIESVDKLLSGREPGDVILLAAPPKVGKSSLANNVINYSVENNIPTYFASGEMPNQKTAARAIAGLSKNGSRFIETGKFFKEEYKKRMEMIDQAVEMTKGKSIFVSDAALSLAAAIADINYYHQKHGVDLFLFDRVGLFEEVVGAVRNDAKSRDSVIATLRRVANTLGITVVLFSQINKEALKTEHKRANGSQIFGGTGGPANCTKAMLVYRPELYEFTEFKAGAFEGTSCKGFAELYSVFNNSGQLGSVKVRFIGERQIFADLVQEDEFVQQVEVASTQSEPDFIQDSDNNDDELPF